MDPRLQRARTHRATQVAFLFLSGLLLDMSSAAACRGYRYWPLNEQDDRLKPSDVVVRAKYISHVATDSKYRAIMGSNIDYKYNILIIEVIGGDKNSSLSSSQELAVANQGEVCEFFRPWSFEGQIKDDHLAIKTLVLRNDVNGWRIAGGE
ncbi:hypothetical protein [Methylorubrum salsuginis]|uniref:hypothetical protein n=1 Tax=Methylorubrum salsuginis TaxID=414703 RepID=UPI001041D55C|nr:hypothetical protein [Methylorubrum salsuginis]